MLIPCILGQEEKRERKGEMHEGLGNVAIGNIDV